MFEAFILAGGQSTRMEREKAIVEINNERLLDRSASIVESAGAGKLTVLAGTKSRVLARFFEQLSVEDDVSPNLGAAGGIFSALQKSEAETVFVLACDLPFVTAELLKKLFSIFESGKHDAVVPLQADGFKQPLCAFYRKSTCAAPFRAQILRSDLTPSARALLDTVKTRYVDFEEMADLEGSSDFFLNINSPADLKFAREIASPK